MMNDTEPEIKVIGWTLSKWSRFPSSVTNHGDSRHPSWYEGKTPNSGVLFSHIHNLSVNMRKHQTKPKLRNILGNIWPLLSSFEVKRDKECKAVTGWRGQRGRGTKCYALFWIWPRTGQSNTYSQLTAQCSAHFFVLINVPWF